MKTLCYQNFLIIILAVLLCLAPAGLAQTYTITDLGDLGSYSQGNGINQSGQVTGYSYLSNMAFVHAFLYSGGVMKDLGTLGGDSSGGMGINGSAQITGWAYLPGNTAFRAFLYSGGTINDLGTMGRKL